jgi:hypothetical protein
MKNARSFFFAISAYFGPMFAVRPGAAFKATSGGCDRLVTSR